MSYGLCPATEDSEIINILLGPSGRGGGEATAAVEISRDISIPVDIIFWLPLGRQAEATAGVLVSVKLWLLIAAF